MKIIVMGTGPFAVPSIRWLNDSDHEICLLVTRPIEDAGRRRKSVANPVLELAKTLDGVPILDPVNVNDATVVDRLAAENADLMFVCDYGQILSSDVLATTRLGGINLHGSLLPKYRGAAPINWAIYHGETETGVTVIHMTPRLDGGPGLAQRSLPIGANDTAEQLEPALATMGVEAVIESIELLESWDGVSAIGEKQDRKRVTKAPRLTKAQGNLDWNLAARQLFNQIRAFQPWPGSFTHWLPVDGKPLRVIVHRATCEATACPQPPGVVQDASDAGISIATGEGVLTIHQLQPSGKKTMTVAEFLRGRKVQVGDLFGKAE